MIAIHARFYGFYFLTIGILMYFQDVRILKSGRRTGLAVLIVFALIVYILKSQIANYLFPPDAGYGTDFMARSVLYRSAIDVLRDFIPFGSGFASFATEISGKYYSQIYAAYGLNAMEGFSLHNWLSVSSSYYPSLVQFGVVGILFYLFFWIHSAGKALVRFKREGDIQWFVITLIITGFIFIENISDAFFSSNKGFFMMMFLGLLAGKYKNTSQKSVVIEVVKDPIPPVEESEPEKGREADEIREESEPTVIVDNPAYEENNDEYDTDDDDDEEYNEDEEYRDEETDTSYPEDIKHSENEDNEVIKKEEGDMNRSKPEEEIVETPLKDEDFNEDFPIFGPLLDDADAEWTQEITEENRDIQKHSETEKQNEDNIREKPTAKDEETNEDDAPIDYII
ncbi:MAG: hypothetical protein LBB90_09535 [Tannerella sp.]|nr:hypothetical protein [Tannerella sp.]